MNVKGIDLDQMPEDLRRRAKAVARDDTIKGVLVRPDGRLSVEVFIPRTHGRYTVATRVEAPAQYERHALDAMPLLMPATILSMGESAWPKDFDITWTSPKSAIPAFVAPERPTEPAKPADTPAVAVLRALLADRQAVATQAENAVKETAAFIERLEKKALRARKDLEHEQTVLAAAQAERDAVEADIAKLGGSV